MRVKQQDECLCYDLQNRVTKIQSNQQLRVKQDNQYVPSEVEE